VARLTGLRERLLFQEGQSVKKGQPLFLIQQNTYQDNLQQAEASVLQFRAQLVYAQAQYERYSKLVLERAGSQSDVDNWRFQRDQAQANLRSAEAAVSLAQL